MIKSRKAFLLWFGEAFTSPFPFLVLWGIRHGCVDNRGDGTILNLSTGQDASGFHQTTLCKLHTMTLVDGEGCEGCLTGCIVCSLYKTFGVDICCSLCERDFCILLFHLSDDQAIVSINQVLRLDCECCEEFAHVSKLGSDFVHVLLYHPILTLQRILALCQTLFY